MGYMTIQHLQQFETYSTLHDSQPLAWKDLETNHYPTDERLGRVRTFVLHTSWSVVLLQYYYPGKHRESGKLLIAPWVSGYPIFKHLFKFCGALRLWRLLEAAELRNFCGYTSAKRVQQKTDKSPWSWVIQCDSSALLTLANPFPLITSRMPDWDDVSHVWPGVCFLHQRLAQKSAEWNKQPI